MGGAAGVRLKRFFLSRKDAKEQRRKALFVFGSFNFQGLFLFLAMAALHASQT